MEKEMKKKRKKINILKKERFSKKMNYIIWSKNTRKKIEKERMRK